MPINLKTEQQKIIKNLETIFNAPSMKPALLQSNLQSIIEKQFNILAYLEKKHKNKIIKSDKLLATYNQLTNKHFNIDRNVKFEDDEVLADDINYLNVYIHNIYKIDIEALASGKNAKIVTPTVNEVTPQNTNANPFPFMMPGMAGNLPPDQNPMYTAMANARIHQESVQGRVYLFKTKPKYIPLVKWIIFGLLLLFFLAALFVGIGMICANGTISDVNASGWTALWYFVLSIIACIVGYQTVSPLIKNVKNENRLYSFGWHTYIALAILFGFILIYGIFSYDLAIFKANNVPWATHAGASSNQMFGLWAWFMGYVFLISSFGLLITMIVIGAVMRPKIDVERLNALMRQYVEESTKAPPPTPPGGQ